MNRDKLPFLTISLIVLALDQLSKFWVVRKIALYESVDIIPGFFRLFHIRNTGAVWGLLDRGSSTITLVLTILSLLAFAVMLWLFHKTDRACALDLAGLSLIMGGAVGNIIDRIRFGNVVDFIELYYRSYHFPTFNIADSSLTVGVSLLIFSILFKRCPDGKGPFRG
jgi:signal peptidase II